MWECKMKLRICYERSGSKSFDTWITFVVFKTNRVDKQNK